MTSAQSVTVKNGKSRAFSSPQSVKIRRQELIAKSVIWFLAAMTIAILVWIIGYLMVKGFWYDNHVPYNVTNQVETAVNLAGSDEDAVFIINSKIRSKDIYAEGLRKLYNKTRAENWGFYNQQDLKVVPLVNKKAGDFSEAVKQFILTGSGLDDYSKNVKSVSSWEDMIQKVSMTPGALGFIPASLAGDLPKGVKVLGVRRLSVAVNDSVMQLQDGRMLRELTSEDENALLSGRVANWKEVGGIDLPVVLVRYDSGESWGALPAGSGTDVPVLTASSKDEFFSLIKSNNGAAALAPNGLLEEEQLSFVPVLRHESGLNLTWHFITEAPARSGQWGGISYIIINTFFLILFTILFSTPVGVMAAIFMVEYAKQGRVLRFLRMGTETLAGIPSIVFGLFGFIFFVRILGFGIGFISSTLTVTLMVLPTIIRTTEEALKSVPQSLREGSLALGATKLQTIVKVVLPAASSGILTGIILAVGRTVGETAVLIYTLGSNYDLVSGPSSSARVLSLHLYMLFSEAVSFDRTFATAAVLVIIILITNLSTTRIIKTVNKNSGM